VDLTDRVVDQLGDARTRTLGLLEPFDDAELRRQVSPLMSPLAWDLAHIGHFEELWLLRELAGAPPTDPRYDDLYDAFKHPRRDRAQLEILDPDGARTYVADVRKRALDHLATTSLDSGDPLLDHAFVYGMIIQHEHQHDETILATINLMEREHPHPELGVARSATPTRPDSGASGCFVRVPGGAVTIGSDHPWAYDNERPVHSTTVAPFRIASSPVTNAEYAAFVDAGGYDDAHAWSAPGWAWRHEDGLEHPLGWRREGEGTWSRLHFGRRDELAGSEPVQHVCFHEAEAFARWSGARLPTEAEWEAAATSGVLDGVGRVWEWTASDFLPYPGFRVFPYAEYSQVFFGDEHKVLRGGSWATHPVVGRTTFRNWDYPIRRQIFSGVRLATDG
jgi:iron(II)-dependent oxidoreductase